MSVYLFVNYKRFTPEIGHILQRQHRDYYKDLITF